MLEAEVVEIIQVKAVHTQEVLVAVVVDYLMLQNKALTA
jgi:hypothetical protein